MNGELDVHVNMTNLAKSDGTLLFELRDPKSKLPYSYILAVPINAGVNNVSGKHIVNPGTIPVSNKVGVPLNRTVPASAAPASSPKP